MLNMRMLEKCMNACIEGEYLYFAIKTEIIVKGIPTYTITIYDSDSLDDEFIKSLRLIYDDNLETTFGMRICAFTFANMFEEIENDLY